MTELMFSSASIIIMLINVQTTAIVLFGTVMLKIVVIETMNMLFRRKTTAKDNISEMFVLCMGTHMARFQPKPNIILYPGKMQRNYG